MANSGSYRWSWFLVMESRRLEIGRGRYFFEKNIGGLYKIETFHRPAINTRKVLAFIVIVPAVGKLDNSVLLHRR